MTDETLHISSLLLRAAPEKLTPVSREIQKIPEAEVALSDPNGQIIVTLETASEAKIVSHLNTLSLIDGVVGAALVFHQTEDANSPEILNR